jgi:uncharacterized membrane protein YeaQ/YmgE (transglycosylase-associated protein family)
MDEVLDERGGGVIQCFPRQAARQTRFGGRIWMWAGRRARRAEGRRVMTQHVMFWFVLVGWAAGWVTGRSMTGASAGEFIDILLGIAGGVGGGYLMRDLEPASNWGFLYAVLVAAASAAILTWVYRRLTGHHRWIAQREVGACAAVGCAAVQ